MANMATTTLNKYYVKIGYPARSRSAIIEATDENNALELVLAKLLAEGEDQDWLNKYASNRDRRTGTCRIE